MEFINKLNQTEIKRTKEKTEKEYKKCLNTNKSNNNMLVFDVDKLNQFK